ncbi:hypothetical protein C8R46DRAFT_1072699 [Mycena filopes]|nr:hypothetical protein C8R46DRAFT_1072699 [Mycena filopes]
MPGPILGSLSLQSPSPATQIVSVSRSTCLDIGSFKAHRSGRPGKNDQACANLWGELVATWSRRKQIIDYCVAVVDQSKEEKQKAAERTQVHNELTVDGIVRKRSLEAFRSRCRYFVPPLTDSEARRMWDSVSTT